ncbi:GNAT family N-acetyltransferase [Fontibacillus sp. BL9]|uniref:GNAT family N-acetyltransferase n=1 Tax=Fontibacillus sp. BL9 TaxID=3389971 RepID=UPI00397DC31D
MMLETDRLIIRTFKGEDWEDLYEYLSQERVVRYEPYGVFTEEECKLEAVRRSQDTAFWAVCLKENQKLIGNLYFHQQEPKELLTWVIGYVFNPDYYGQGFASESSRRLMQYAFEQLGSRRIVAMCNPENNASWRLMERLNMRREGHLRKNIFFKFDEENRPIWQDTYQYAILSEEWRLPERAL